MNPTRRSWPNGLTLVEVLATTALLGIVAAVLLGSWSAPAQRSRFRALVDEVKGLDARARVAARTGAPVALALDPTRHRLVVNLRFGGETVAEVSLPQDVEVALLRDRAIRSGAVRFDPCGTSCDYALDLRDGTHHARVEFAGLTGWSSTLEAVP